MSFDSEAKEIASCVKCEKPYGPEKGLPPWLVKLKTWKNMIEHIRDLNAQGYDGSYEPALKAGVAVAAPRCLDGFAWAALCAGEDGIELFLERDRDELIEVLLEDAEGEENDSAHCTTVWHNDRKVPFDVVRSVTFKEGKVSDDEEEE